ncbi:terminase small subunit [Cycloclasticus pugetii]|jgi:phage terminase small subunit|uniref:terminase small subunit n=1 Tax=Cycloclasticus pugetii TaxID=34068 RepID=UPI000910C164|nr:terminase small subunit [Cycloclasticus pugetii]SHJ32344.1 Terminase small subunit [Cycloclasticus pugetii]
MKLTPKQVRFVDEYLIDFNASRAAVAAGFSSKSAKVQGSRLLTNVNLIATIQRRQKATERRLEVTRDTIIQGLIIAAEQARENKDPASMIAAMSEVSKMMGFYASKPCNKMPETDYDSQKRKFEVMSDRELRALL